MARPSYAVDVEHGTGLIVLPSRARSRPDPVDFMRVRWQADIPGVLTWLRSLGVQHIVHHDASRGDDGRVPALTLFLRHELHTAMYGDVLVLPLGLPGTYAHRMQILSGDNFDERYSSDAP